MTEHVEVAVTFRPQVGFVSVASNKVPQSLSAPTLDRLRFRVIMLLFGRREQPMPVHLALDAAAAAEAARRQPW